MGNSRTLRYAILIAAFAAPVVRAQENEEQSQKRDPLTAELAENRLTLRLDADGRLAGPGAELLLAEGRAAQFLLVGEEHGVAEIPALTAALYRALEPHGYRHLAVEIGRALADTLNALAAGDEPLAALRDFYRAHPPGPPFYTLEEEARLLADAVRASDDRRDVLWGLDYDIVGDRYALRRLRDLAPGRGARRTVDRAIAFADSQYAAALESGNLSGTMMFAGPDSLLAAVREALAPAPGSEADRILSLLERTLHINHLFVSRKNYESNLERARLNRATLIDYYDEAAARTGEPPRVMFKFGLFHMMRGRTFTNVFDLGNLTAELAAANGMKSFHLLAVAGAGSRTAGFDSETFGWTPVPSQVQAADWTAPLFDAADSEAWTLFDFRQLRPLLHAERLGDVHESLERLIWSYDAMVVLVGSVPSQSLSRK